MSQNLLLFFSYPIILNLNYLEKNKIQYDGKTTCIIDKISESGSTKKYSLVYDKIDVNISEIDTSNVYYYVGQDVIFNNVKYRIKKIDGNNITIKCKKTVNNYN